MSDHERIESYLKRLLGYAMSLVRHREEAHDLVQESVLKALSAKKVPKDEPAYRAWLFRILRNLFLERSRNENRRASIIELLIEEPEIEHSSPALFDRITIERTLQTLSADHHEILALIDIAGFTYSEAAALLDVPVGTVMSRVSRAREALLKQLTAKKIKPARAALPLEQFND